MTVSLNHLGDLARKRVAVAAYYFVPGVVFASWASYSGCKTDVALE